jgi:hypothetical protein
MMQKQQQQQEHASSTVSNVTAQHAQQLRNSHYGLVAGPRWTPARIAPHSSTNPDSGCWCCIQVLAVDFWCLGAACLQDSCFCILARPLPAALQDSCLLRAERTSPVERCTGCCSACARHSYLQHSRLPWPEKTPAR